MLELKFIFDDKDLKLIRQIPSTAEKDFNKAIFKSINLVRNYAIDHISRGIRTGKETTRYKPKRKVIPSVKGEFPKSDTGRLVGSIRTNFSNLSGEVGTDVQYGSYLETKKPEDGGRPWLEPSLDANREKIEGIFHNAIKEIFKL